MKIETTSQDELRSPSEVKCADIFPAVPLIKMTFCIYLSSNKYRLLNLNSGYNKGC
jgi:hypothetical protein